MLSSHHRIRHLILWLCLLLEFSLLVSSTVTISQPNAGTTWTPGQSYDIVIKSDGQDSVQSWQVDLVVLGAECEDICLHDGIVKEISQGHNIQSTLRFTVPTDLVQHGKGFQVHFSNAGSAPVYHSETFTIERASKDPATPTTTGPSAITTARTENAASYVLPAALVTAFSCVFAFMLI